MDRHIDRHQVRRLREAKLWTQEDLAERCRVNARTVQRVEASGVGSAHTMRVIAEALDVDPATLYSGAPPTEPASEAFDLARELPWTGIAAAFLWVALASLAYVASAEPGLVTASVAAMGFGSFVIGLWCWRRGQRDTLCA